VEAGGTPTGAPDDSHGEASRAALGALSDRLDKMCERLSVSEADRAELSGVSKNVDQASQRLQATEAAVSALSERVDQACQRLQETPRVGISPKGDIGGQLDMRGILDTLMEQVAELQQKVDVGQTESTRCPGDKDSSLSPGDKDSSLNFSLTEKSRKDLSFADPLVSQARPSSKEDDDGEVDMLGPASSSDKPGGRRGGGLAGGHDDALDGLVGDGRKPGRGGGGSGDILDSLVGGGDGHGAAGGGGRPRPPSIKVEAGDDRSPLAPVAEESSDVDVGEQSHESHHSRASQDSQGKIRGSSQQGRLGSKSRSPLESPNGGSDGPLCVSQMSMSGNEVSVGVDYSVEDSLELDKCDHVEAVKPNALRRQAALGLQGAAGAGTDGAPAPSMGLPLPSRGAEPDLREGAPDALPKPKVAGVDVLDALMSPKSDMDTARADALDTAAQSKASSNPVVSPRTQPADEARLSNSKNAGSPDGDEYEQEEFEGDDMSVPESIPEESMEENSGSDEEDV